MSDGVKFTVKEYFAKIETRMDEHAKRVEKYIDDHMKKEEASQEKMHEEIESIRLELAKIKNNIKWGTTITAFIVSTTVNIAIIVFL